MRYRPRLLRTIVFPRPTRQKRSRCKSQRRARDEARRLSEFVPRLDEERHATADDADRVSWLDLPGWLMVGNDRHAPWTAAGGPAEKPRFRRRLPVECPERAHRRARERDTAATRRKKESAAARRRVEGVRAVRRALARRRD